MIDINKSTIIWVLSVIVFLGAVVGVSFILGGKSNKESSQADHPAEHNEGQSIYEDKFNALIGQTAPDFELYSYNGEKIRLQEQRGKKVVLFFTEGVMCYPSCWNQIAAFGKDEVFKKEDTVVFSIVVDTKNEWEKAIDKMPELGDSTILLDLTKSVSKEYGVLSLQSSMHKGQFPGHTYLIIDKAGIVRFIKDDSEMAVRNDVLKEELAKLN